MNKNYTGAYATNWSTLLFSREWGLAGIFHGDSLEITADKLIVNMKGNKVELLKEQIVRVKNYWYYGAIRIEHSNQQLPSMLVFSPIWPFGLIKNLRANGYPI